MLYSLCQLVLISFAVIFLRFYHCNFISYCLFNISIADSTLTFCINVSYRLILNGCVLSSIFENKQRYNTIQYYQMYQAGLLAVQQVRNNAGDYLYLHWLTDAS